MTGKRPFSEIVSAHGTTVLRICRSTLGHAEADDAWSETFLSALQAYPTLPVDANVEAWLVTIAKRKVIDLVRKTGRLPSPTSDVPSDATELSTEGSDVDVDELLRRLPDRQRLAVRYHYLDGLPYAEVAAEMGGSPEAARRAASDGIAKLRRAREVTDDRPRDDRPRTERTTERP